MISFVLPILWTISILKHVAKHEDVSAIVFLSIILTPTVLFVGQRINCMYYLCFLFGLIASLKHLVIDRKSICFLLCLSMVIFLSFLGWIINGEGSFFVPFLGELKFIIVAFELFIIFNSYEKEQIENGFQKAMITAIVLNAIVVVLSLLIPVHITSIVELFYYNDDTINASESIINGKMARAYGLFNHPAALALFSLFSLVFFLKNYFKVAHGWFFLFLSMLTGLLAFSKTFIIGFPIVIIIWLLFYGKALFRSKAGSILLIIMLALFFLFVISFDSILGFIRERSPVLAYYLGFLKDPAGSLNTRYSSSAGNLAPLYKIISEHPIIGVGPNPIMGEVVLDSAPLTILHDGGVLRLLVVMAMYAGMINDCIKKRRWDFVLYFVIVFLSGFGLPTWVFSQYTFPFIVYILLCLRCSDL